ncbi:Cytochrome P450 [Dillenia turbinata]|uniref:Cytochrome P450 n=1 Tax=Dillenia turbinata TaxID=194707 RepID=A0AAN8VNN2_9MAGN
MVDSTPHTEFDEITGIRGPSYKFMHGNTKEILTMTKEARSKPMELSHDTLPRLLPHVHSWTKLYGMITLFWIGPGAVLITMESEIVPDVLNHKDGAYQRQKIEGLPKKLFGEGIVGSEGEKWAKLRKIANHTFHADSLKDMIPAMISSAEAMLLRRRDYEGQEIEVYEEFRVLASEETTATLLAWTVLLLAIHDDWQEKARKEVFELFGQDKPGLDGIARLKTMNMIINESLRLYPPITSLSRIARRETRVGKLTFPANIFNFLSQF